MIRSITILFIATFIISASSYAQNPGNVGVANLTGWFKPDALPLGNVTTWTTTLSTIGPITVTDATAPYPQATNTPAGDVSNYNTTLYFNNNTTANLQALTNTTGLSLMQNSSGSTSTGTFFCAYHFPGGGVINNHMMLWNNGTSGIQFRNLGGSGRIAIGNGGGTTANASRDWFENNTPTIMSLRGNRSSATSLDVFENDWEVIGGGASQSSGPNGLYLGVYPGNNNAPFNGYLHEYIFYNTSLTALQMNRVHTYLAVKYGITLDMQGVPYGGDYTATNGSLIWDASLNPVYHNNVVGIGRDDNQSLYQKQSHAFDDNYRVYINNLAANVAGNTGTINLDASYVMMGQTLNAGCATAGANAESPAFIDSRMEREWKVTKTNFAQDFNWDVRIDTCQIAGTSVGPVNPNNLHLLVDLDGNFQDAVSYTNGGGTVNISYNNGVVSVTGISNLHIPDNSTRYFTIGYNVVDITIAQDETICLGDSSLLTINVSVPGPVNVSYSDGTTTTALNNISDGYTFYVAPTVTTTYSILNQTNFLNCCGASSPYDATITVNQPPVITATATPNPMCLGDSSQLTGGGGATYVWDNGGVDGQWVSPIANTSYQVVGTDAFGCVDSATVLLNVVTNPIVGATATSDTVCFGTPVTLNGTGATTYFWTNGVTDNTPFTPATTATYLVTGSIGTCTDTASIQIVVNPLPIVQANVVTSPICLNDSTALFGTGAATYTWDNGVIDNVYFTPAATTLYTVTGTDANGCMNTNNITVTVNPLPTVVANASSTVLCLNDSTQLTASGATTYVWDNGIMDGDWTTPLVTTLYTVIGTDVNGCLDTTDINITVNPNPFVTITASVTTLCIGDPVTLSGNGATTYTWDNGVVDNVSFNPTLTNTYNVIGTNGFGCTDTSNVQVIVNNLPNVTANASSLGVCEGDPLVLNGAGAVSYTWDNSVVDGVSFIPAVAANYTVTGTDANGCINTDNVFVDFYPIFPFTLGPDTVVCPQVPISLEGNDIFSSYLWSNGSIMPRITINIDGTYTLTVRDINGCEYTDDIYVELGEDCFVTLYIPNAFTPDDDEHNRYLRTTGSFIKFFHMEIYNRWGEQVFVTDDIDTHWDGTYAGRICPQGIYSYVVKYAHDLNTDDKLTQTGHINILR